MTHELGQENADYTTNLSLVSLPQNVDICTTVARIRAGNSAGMSAPSEAVEVGKLGPYYHMLEKYRSLDRCYEVRIEESKKVGSCHELNPAVPIEDCEGWGLPGSHSSVAEPWQLKPGVLEGPLFVYTEGKSEQCVLFAI